MPLADVTAQLAEFVDIGFLPPVLALVFALGGLALRWMKQRDTQKKSEWDRMRDLLNELKDQRDHERTLNDALVEDNARLRRDLRQALRDVEHHREELP